MIANEMLKQVPLLVLANKQDLPDCMVMPVSALNGYTFHYFELGT